MHQFLAVAVEHFDRSEIGELLARDYLLPVSALSLYLPEHFIPHLPFTRVRAVGLTVTARTRSSRNSPNFF